MMKGDCAFRPRAGLSALHGMTGGIALLCEVATYITSVGQAPPYTCAQDDIGDCARDACKNPIRVDPRLQHSGTGWGLNNEAGRPGGVLMIVLTRRNR